MKQVEYTTANQPWNAGATEIQQLNPGVPDQAMIFETFSRVYDGARNETCVFLVNQKCMTILQTYFTTTVY